MRRTVKIINETRTPAIESSRGNMNEIRVEIRVIYPPQATEAEISQVLYKAHIRAQKEMRGD